MLVSGWAERSGPHANRRAMVCRAWVIERLALPDGTMRMTAEASQCDRARQNATTCSSAVFIGEAGNSASASTAIAP